MSAHELETVLALVLLAGGAAGFVIGLAVSLRGKR